MYKLCGGTFFVLLLNSRKKGIERDLLRDMLKIFKPDLYIDESSFKEQTKKFKICKEHSNLATPFEEAATRKKMTDDINGHYEELLAKMTKFIDKHIAVGSDTQKEKILVKALLEVIEQDNSIPKDQDFYIQPDGKSVTKEELVSLKKAFLPSFLLGVLYYVMINIEDNMDGAETYDEWCPKPDSGTQRKYTANLGEKSNKQIELINTPEKNDYCEPAIIEQSERIDVYDKVFEAHTIERVIPSKIPFIKKRVKATVYVEKRKKRKPD